MMQVLNRSKPRTEADRLDEDRARLLSARTFDRGEFARRLHVSLRTFDRRRLTGEIPKPDEWDKDRPLWLDSTVEAVLLSRRRSDDAER